MIEITFRLSVGSTEVEITLVMEQAGAAASKADSATQGLQSFVHEREGAIVRED